MKHALLILFLAYMQSASAQVTTTETLPLRFTFAGTSVAESELLYLCGTKTPTPGFYADEYGRVLDVRCSCGILYQSESGRVVHCTCWTTRQVNLSPVRRLPIRLKLVISQAKIGA